MAKQQNYVAYTRDQTTVSIHIAKMDITHGV